jgi:ATP-dependent DNA helicase DinG
MPGVPTSDLAPLELRTATPDELGLDGGVLARLVEGNGPIAVIDLETTGLSGDPEAEVIELGVVLLDPGVENVSVAHSFMRPSAPLPRLIKRLTGLADEDLVDAPLASEVVEPVCQLLSGRVLVAHNAPFERWFLARKFASELDEADYLDTQDILALTHPDSSDLRLETFTRGMLGTDERHRALDDALDTARVLSRVGRGADAGESRYATARAALETWAPESPWLSLLGKESGLPERETRSAYVAIGESDEPPVPFDEEAIAAILSDEARCRRYLPGYRARAAQVELARHFVRAFRDGGAFLLEGGTGVGKSLAYLSAAIPFALERAAAGIRAPVVVSTRTKLLQDQLLEKDIPAAARILGYPSLRALSIKGRANYVCQRRLETVLAEGRQPRLFAEDRLAYAALFACARTRPFGEIGALPPALLRRFESLHSLRRRSVSPRAQHCSREECAKQPDCPFGRRRSALGDAHLVVANHDLLLRWPPDYPSYEHVVVDEAHELADVADEVYAVEVRPEEVLDRFDEVFGAPGEKGGPALLSGKRRRSSAKDAQAWRRAIALDLRDLGRALASNAGDWGDIQLPDPPGEGFEDATETADTASRRLDDVADAVSDFADEEGEDRGAALLRVADELRESARGLRLAFNGTGGEAVAAFERVLSPYDRWRLAVRPVSPADPFHERFLEGLSTFAGVSASLFVGDDSFPAVGILELEERSPVPVERFSVPSPFPYAEHMRAVAMNPEGDLVEETAAVIGDLALRLGGRTLGLFTSLARMNRVAELLTERLRPHGIEVLAPRSGADDPNALVERFRGGGEAVLLGARTFWQGLDIPGPDLQALVIEKLPFEVPTQLRKRREARMKAAGIDAFGRDTLGTMLLYLKQMVGRLIRSEDDRGIVVIVEGRTDKRYFRRLGDALPSGVGFRVAERGDLPAILAEVGIQGERE